MASESSRLLHASRSGRSQYRAPGNIQETSLSDVSDSGFYVLPQNGHRQRSETETELNELIIALDRAREAVQAQIDSQVVHNVGKRPKPLIPHWITNYLLLITFLGQSLTIGLIEVVEKVHSDTGSNSTQHDVELGWVLYWWLGIVGIVWGHNEQHRVWSELGFSMGRERGGSRREYESHSNILLTVLQAAHLLLVFVVSFKVAKQVLHHTVSGSLIAQSYLSTVLLFAGLYTLIYRFNPHSWKSVTQSGKHLSPILLFLRMLYFSVSTATLCGTSEVEPIIWYTNTLVAFQMLTSFVYFTSILSSAILPRRRSQFDQPAGRMKSLTGRIRRWMFRQSRTGAVHNL